MSQTVTHGVPCLVGLPLISLTYGIDSSELKMPELTSLLPTREFDPYLEHYLHYTSQHDSMKDPLRSHGKY